MLDMRDKVRKTSKEQPDERAPKTGQVPGEGPKRMIVAMPSDALPDAGLSPEERKKQFEAQMQMVWDYADGNPWKWETKRPTPAGYKCDVLTFSGSEMITPGRKPSRFRKRQSSHSTQSIRRAVCAAPAVPSREEGLLGFQQPVVT